MATPPTGSTERTRLRRRHDRGSYDAASIHAVLDASPICSVGYVFNDHPYVTSTLQWREGDRVYWHGSSASQMLRATDQAKVCMNVSILDGFVMARSGFNHSTNYRSVMIFGTAEKVTDPDKKEQHLKTFVDGLFPGRWDILRPPTIQEMKSTTVLSMPIDEASVKVRTGLPGDDEEDLGLPIWSGIIPVSLHVGTPQPDPRMPEGTTKPSHIRDFKMT